MTLDERVGRMDGDHDHRSPATCKIRVFPAIATEGVRADGRKRSMHEAIADDDTGLLSGSRGADPVRAGR